MKTIGSLILLTALAMIFLAGTIASEATAAGNVIFPILTVMGFAVLVIGAIIALNAYI